MNHSFNALLKVNSIKSSSLSLIRLCDNVVYRVEKSYVDKLLPTIVEINVGGEYIFRTFRNNFANSRIRNYF